MIRISTISTKTLTHLSSLKFSQQQKITFPQLKQANLQSQQGKYIIASTNYLRTIEIMNTAKLNSYQNQQYLQAVYRYCACQFLGKKYGNVKKMLANFYGIGKSRQNVNININKYMLFVGAANKINLQGLENYQEENSSNSEKQINSIMLKLMGKNPNNIQSKQFPNLGYISNILNNGADYRKLLVNLIERSPKSQKTPNPRQNFKIYTESSPNTQLQLLFHLSSTLNLSTLLTTADKQLINNRVNSTLKLYEIIRPKQVYKPLLNIIMSLIAQNHYMSAQGMIGFVRNQELQLIKGDQSMDKLLVNNLYRMLVTRANNQSYDIGWGKQRQLKLGDLVVERIIKAALLGHSLQKLLC